MNAQGRNMSPANSQDFGMWLTRQLGLNLMKLAMGLNRMAKARSQAKTALESFHNEEYARKHSNEFAVGTHYITGISQWSRLHIDTRVRLIQK